MERIGRVLTVAGATGLLLWMTSCAKPAGEGTPTAAAGAGGGAPVTAEAKPAEAGAVKPKAGAVAAGSELEQLKSKVAALESYELSMSDKGKTFNIKAKLKDGKPLKMRIDTSEGEGWMTYDLGTKTMYMVNEAKKEAMKMVLDETMTKDLPDSVGESIDMIAKENPKLSSEKIDGVDCWKAITGKDKEQSTCWFSKEHGLPMQVKSGDQTMKLNYTNINKVDDKVFELPKGLKITDMSAMMKGMQDKAKK